MGYKRGPMWGSSCAADISVAKQLARVDLPEPRDVTIYLYGWATPDNRNVSAGFYDIAIGSGGTAFTMERVLAPARGRVIHFVTANVVVNASPPGYPVGGMMAKAHIGLGRPSEVVFQDGGTAPPGNFSMPIVLPPFVTQTRIVGAFADGTHGPPPIDAFVQVAQANDPQFLTAIPYPLSALQSGIVPITRTDGFIRLGASGGGYLFMYQHTVVA